jgi:hypothetical protein
MALNIGASGSIKPYVKYNSKADKWFTKGPDGDLEITRPTFLADFKNIATGYLRFREGQAPERIISPSLDVDIPNPGQDFKRGFVLAVFSQRFFGGAAEMSSASIHVGNAIKEIYQQYEERLGNYQGQIPVIECTGSEAMKDSHGTNYRPKLNIVKWVDRPAELPDESPVDAADVWKGNNATKPAPAATVAAPAPAAKPAPANPLAEAEF